MSISTPTDKITPAGNTANLAAYTTAAVVLDANKLYILQIVGYRTAGLAVSSVVHDAAGTPLNFAKISDGTDDAAQLNYDVAAHRVHEAWFVIPSSTTASAAITITWSSAQSSAGWRLIEVASGFDATGGATTFPGVAKATGNSNAPAVTMASYAATDNLTLLLVAWGSGTSNPTQTIAPTESRTELSEHNDGERSSCAAHYQNPNGGDTSIGATLSATNNWGAIGIEIAVAAAAGATGDLSQNVPLALSAAAKVDVQGTLANALPLTLTTDVDVLVQASLSQNIPLALSAAGVVAVQGALSLPLPLSLTASGTVGAAVSTGDLSTALPLALTASGSVTVQGSLARPLPLALAADADLLAQGSLSRPLPLALTATAAAPVQGTLARALPLALSATGAVAVQGILSQALPLSLTASGSLVAGPSGDLAKPLPLVLAATGVALVQGSLSRTLPVVLVADGAVFTTAAGRPPYGVTLANGIAASVPAAQAAALAAHGNDASVPGALGVSLGGNLNVELT